MSIDIWMDKDVVYIHNGVVLSHKKEWNNICNNTDATRDYNIKWSQKEKDKYHTISHIWNLKYDTNELIYWNRSRIRDMENRMVVTKGEGSGRGLNWEFEISRCKLIYIEWINNKVLLCSTGNYIQYPVIKHSGKEYEKECIYVCACVCVTESLCCRAVINTTL